jgi:hypothetical protein
MDNLIDKDWHSQKAKTKKERHKMITRAPPFPFGKTRLQLEELLVKLRTNSKKAKQIREQLKYWGDKIDNQSNESTNNTG